tara:strand:+ start:7601 stop:8404 length:804 start_codon:yes stop_codon:yes gene_type:complete
MKNFKFGCHSFLNSKPILIPLIEKNISNLEIIQESPADLALMLRREKLDLSFVPSIEYAKNSGYLLVNNISISSCGTVGTVLLISKKKMEDIKTVATDNRSLSSITLLKILFKEKYNRLPFFQQTDPDYEKMLSSNDAAMLIGDTTFSLKRNGKTIYDLSEEWFQLTGKPFVHAVLCARKEAQVDQNIIKTILKSRDEGLASIEQISKYEARALAITKEKCADYLKNKIRYTLGQDEQEGLNEFFSLANKHGFIKSKPELNFIDDGK